MRRLALILGGILAFASTLVAADDPAMLGRQARQILDKHCHRCHGQDGAVEGGMNYILDAGKLVARRKVVPGQPDQSPLFKRVSSGKMPPPGENPRPAASDVEVLRRWIAAGAPAGTAPAAKQIVGEASLQELMLADVETVDKRSRRFLRYFSLLPLANAGLSEDELQTYRNALAKLLNSLSWHPRITKPKAIDPAGLLLRVDLRDFQWDANLWNRLLQDYPYGILHDTAVARAVMAATATRMPVVRVDWFVATACRPPLYYELLQIPANLTELERQLRVDATQDIQQERVARLGFNGSGISRNNRVLERHDAETGVYWRTYDFDAVPQNLIERDLLLPDRRNLFAYPLGPGGTDNFFQHAGGEAIFSLPNGLHGFLLVNANNVRIDKGPTAIVSDPKRPDRAVEPGVSCMTCHYRGILPKDDQIRDHVAKNPKAFSRAAAEVIRALYPPKEKMRALMEEDAERYRLALEKTGNKVSVAEVVSTITLRHEADVDLATLAAEAGLKPEELLGLLAKSESLTRSLGGLRVPGGTVSRQVVAQSFGDIVRQLRIGNPLQAGIVGESLPDSTGEVDPLESQSSPANAAAISVDGRLAAFASADKSVVLWDVEAGRALRRCIGHTASVWCVAFSRDGIRLLSGSKDGTVRLWDVETAREITRLEGHADLVTTVAFSPDGRKALSAGLDHEVILWDLEKGKSEGHFASLGAKYVNALAFAPDGGRALACAANVALLIDPRTGKTVATLQGHTAAVTSAAFSHDGRRILTGSDDRTVRLWDAESAKLLRTLTGHESYVRGVAFSADGKQALSGGTDTTVLLWDLEGNQPARPFRKHRDSVVAVAFLPDGSGTISVSRDAAVHPWALRKGTTTTPTYTPPSTNPLPTPTKDELRPTAVIPVGGAIGDMILSPDRQYLYYLNLTASKLARVELKTGKRDRVLPLAEGTEIIRLSRDGKTLVAIAPVRGPKEGEPIVASQFQVIDPATMAHRRSFVLRVVAYDAAVADSGILYVSGGGSDWTTIAAIDLAKEKVRTQWGGVWTRSFLQLSPDQKRLYYSSQGITPGRLDFLTIPGRLEDAPPPVRSATVPSPHVLGGAFQMTPDGRFLLCKTGVALEAGENVRFHTVLEPLLSAAFDADAKTGFLLTRDGFLKQFSYPDFKLHAAHRLPLAAYRLAFDGAHGRLYVAGVDPKTAADRPRDRGLGDIHVFELATKGTK